jgi:hypothetical protein
MTNDMEPPPKFVFAADQGFALAQDRLNEVIATLAEEMKERPEQGDAVPWAASVMFMLQNQAQNGAISSALMEIWQAAMYRLARLEVEKTKCLPS